MNNYKDLFDKNMGTSKAQYVFFKAWLSIPRDNDAEKKQLMDAYSEALPEISRTEDEKYGSNWCVD